MNTVTCSYGSQESSVPRCSVGELSGNLREEGKLGEDVRTFKIFYTLDIRWNDEAEQVFIIILKYNLHPVHRACPLVYCRLAF